MSGPYLEADAENAQPSSYPFLIQSQVSLTQDVPPRVDSNMMTRQKRRRTSPEDHAILEAAYQRNSKPDKAERTAIVSSVGLGEKEVQIWFQNRRQNDRRKSRPLLPHEMVPHFRNSVPEELLHESPPSSQDGETKLQMSFSSFEDSGRSHSSSSSGCDERTQNTSRASSIHDLLNPITPAESICSTSFESHTAGPESTQSSQPTIKSREISSSVPSYYCRDRSAPSSPRTNKAEGDSIKNVAQSGSQFVLSKSSSSTVAPHSSEKPRGPAGEKLAAEHFASIERPTGSRKRVFDEVEGSVIPSSQSSGVRLSMKIDGSVKVKTTDEETPSPPKQRPQTLGGLRKEGLRRSHSAVAASELMKEGQKSRSRPGSGIFGRSRDARTWEFYCDGDARTALSAQAENENNGSAVGAINLIRSQIQNAKSKAPQRGKGTALKPKFEARNTRKQAASTEKKPKLVRAMSSMARLACNFQDSVADVGKYRKPSQVQSPSGDSDKENWAPGTRSASHPLRRVQPSSSVSRGTLQDQMTAETSKDYGMRHPDGRNTHIRYNPEGSPFERDGLHSDSFTHDEDKEEDLDCIQGLLSLSQGAWK